MNSLKGKSHFSLFQTPIDLAHSYWEKLLRKDDWAVDATCGNGKDTLKLAQLLPLGGVIALDIQQQAILNTKQLLDTHRKLNFHLFCRCHTQFPDLARQFPIRLIVYNLGYLPGGNKEQTTLTPSTLASLEKAFQILAPAGAISIICYPGHSEGDLEEKAILKLVNALDSKYWSVCYHQWKNRFAAPSLIFLQKSL